jgi:hypothetical protein
MSDDQTRVRRVNYEGEWEYECIECKEWHPKEKFGGCKTYVDGFGNCLMCLSCRASINSRGIKQREMERAKEISKIFGVYDYPTPEDWLEAMAKKHGIR